MAENLERKQAEDQIFAVQLYQMLFEAGACVFLLASPARIRQHALSSCLDVYWWFGYASLCVLLLAS